MKKQKNFLLSLTHDIVFRNYFKECRPALKSLLKAFLPLPKDSSIQKVAVLDSSPPLLKEKEKSSVMDLRLLLNNGEKVGVEMQTCSHPGFKERVLFYWAKNYSSGLKTGDEYKNLCPVYSLIFTTFKLFSGTSGYYNTFSIRSEQPPHFCFNKDLCFVTAELSKFQKKPKLDLRGKWCYLLKESGRMDEREYRDFLRKNPEMEEPMVYLRKLSQEESLEMEEEAREKARRDRVAREDYVFEKGMKKGLQTGRQEGLQTGRQEGLRTGMKKGLQTGMKKGLQTGRQELIFSMLKNGADIKFVSKYTGLSEEEIKKLKNGR